MRNGHRMPSAGFMTRSDGADDEIVPPHDLGHILPRSRQDPLSISETGIRARPYRWACSLCGYTSAPAPSRDAAIQRARHHARTPAHRTRLQDRLPRRHGHYPR